MGWGGSAPDAVNASQTQFGARIRRKNLTKTPALVVSRRHRRTDHVFSRSDPVISASRGTLAGDMLWLATIAFVFAILAGLVG